MRQSLRTISPLLVLACVMGVTTSVNAQQIAVQQPVVGSMSLRTSVAIPDRGRIQLGGVSSAQSSRSQSGFYPRGSNLGLSRSSRSASASVTIIDLREMDEAILNSVPSSSPANTLRAMRPVEKPFSPIQLAPQDKAAHFERLAQRADEQGKPGVAKLHRDMAAKCQ